MAMVTCSECGRAVSNKAAACIGCGAPLGVSPDINYVAPTKAATPPSPAQIRRRTLLSLTALMMGVFWASMVDHAHASHRLPLFLAALLIIGGLCGLLVSLVHSVTVKT